MTKMKLPQHVESLLFIKIRQRNCTTNLTVTKKISDGLNSFRLVPRLHSDSTPSKRYLCFKPLAPLHLVSVLIRRPRSVNKNSLIHRFCKLLYNPEPDEEFLGNNTQ